MGEIEPKGIKKKGPIFPPVVSKSGNCEVGSGYRVQNLRGVGSERGVRTEEHERWRELCLQWGTCAVYQLCCEIFILKPVKADVV